MERRWFWHVTMIREDDSLGVRIFFQTMDEAFIWAHDRLKRDEERFYHSVRIDRVQETEAGTVPSLAWMDE